MAMHFIFPVWWRINSRMTPLLAASINRLWFAPALAGRQALYWTDRWPWRGPIPGWYGGAQALYGPKSTHSFSLRPLPTESIQRTALYTGAVHSINWLRKISLLLTKRVVKLNGGAGLASRNTFVDLFVRVWLIGLLSGI